MNFFNFCIGLNGIGKSIFFEKKFKEADTQLKTLIKIINSKKHKTTIQLDFNSFKYRKKFIDFFEKEKNKFNQNSKIFNNKNESINFNFYIEKKDDDENLQQMMILDDLKNTKHTNDKDYIIQNPDVNNFFFSLFSENKNDNDRILFLFDWIISFFIEFVISKTDDDDHDEIIIFIDEPTILLDYESKQEFALFFSKFYFVNFEIISHSVEFLKWFLYFFNKNFINISWFETSTSQFYEPTKIFWIGDVIKNIGDDQSLENFINCFFYKKLFFVEDKAHKIFIEKLAEILITENKNDFANRHYNFYIFVTRDKTSVMQFYEYFKERLEEIIMNKNFFVVFDKDDKVKDKKINDKFEKIKNNICFLLNIEDEYFEYSRYHENCNNLPKDFFKTNKKECSSCGKKFNKNDLRWIDKLFNDYKNNSLVDENYRKKIQNKLNKIKHYLMWDYFSK